MSPKGTGAGAADAHGVLRSPLRLGIAGHRKLRATWVLRWRVDRGLKRIRRVIRGAGIDVHVLTALAEGADQLVAERAVRVLGASLDVQFPMSAEHYRATFSPGPSLDKLDQLLDHAIRTRSLPDRADEDEAFRRGSEVLVRRCDILFAVWDGKLARGPGGTGDSVTLARAIRRPVLWIRSTPSAMLREPFRGDRAIGMLRDVASYNRANVRVDGSLEGRRFDASGLAGTNPVMQPFIDWIEPFFVRADQLAARYKRQFLASGVTVYLGAAAAVFTVAIQDLYFPDLEWIVLIEFGLMVLVLVTFIASRSLRFHQRWLTCRNIAEWLRTAPFLLFLGASPRLLEPDDLVTSSFNRSWMSRKHLRDGEPAISPTYRDIVQTWLDTQIRYYGRSERANRLMHQTLFATSAALFLVTLVAAGIHGLAHEAARGLGENTLTLLTIALPALGASVNGLRAQGEYLRNATRFGQIGASLRRLSARIETEAGLDPRFMRSLVKRAATELSSERSDWTKAMDFHEPELS